LVNGDPVPRAQFLTACRIGFYQTHHIHVGQAEVFLDMEIAEVANPDDGRAECSHLSQDSRRIACRDCSRRRSVLGSLNDCAITKALPAPPRRGARSHQSADTLTRAVSAGSA
jgi:hypothetical protein